MQNLLSLNTAKQQKIPHPQCLNLGGDYSYDHQKGAANQRLALYMSTDYVGLYIRENRAHMRLGAA